MRNYYVCKARYGKENDEGIMKQVTEAYLVDGVNYTDAESSIYKHLEESISGTFDVTSITKTNISEVVNIGDSDLWWKCKVAYKTSDGDSGKELKINSYILMNAESSKQAAIRMELNLSEMLVPYNIPSLTQMNIVEVCLSDQDAKVG